jgi:hypothetical protein
MSEHSLADTIVPKSNQLNADDLLAHPITVTVQAVKRAEGDQPVAIHLEGDYRPYMPCKSMRRVLISAWGDDGREWVGRSMTLYCDPEVQFGGVKVGGIRISHLSHIANDLQLSLTTTHGKRKPYTVKKLVEKFYPEDKFAADLPKMIASIDAGKTTVEKIIAFLEKTAKLTADQKARIVATPKSEPENEFITEE